MPPDPESLPFYIFIFVSSIGTIRYRHKPAVDHEMLTESFIVSTESLEKSNNANSVKDVGIHHYDFQPLPARKSSYKKSSTKQNCLAVTTTHIFAAQAEKSIVHVYEREKGTQEAVVPFPERICSIALSRHGDSASTLVLGTEGGRVILWEVMQFPKKISMVQTVDASK